MNTVVRESVNRPASPSFAEGFRALHAALDQLQAELLLQDARIAEAEAAARRADARAAAWERRDAELRRIAASLSRVIAAWRRPWAWLVLVGALSGACAWALLYAATGKP